MSPTERRAGRPVDARLVDAPRLLAEHLNASRDW
jgi:hypothetical protein